MSLESLFSTNLTGWYPPFMAWHEVHLEGVHCSIGLLHVHSNEHARPRSIDQEEGSFGVCVA